MIEIRSKSVKLSDGEIKKVPRVICLKNGIKIECVNEINFFIELNNQILVLVDNYHAGNLIPGGDVGRNIFCYDKETGEQIWQVESSWDSVYTGMGLRIKQEDGSYIPGGIRAGEWGQVMSTTYLDKEFRKGIDYVQARTFSCHEYELDIDTGNVKFLRQGK